MKKCSKCKKDKELYKFYNYRGSPDGKTYQCIECMSETRDSRKDIQKNYMKNLRLLNNEKIKETKRKSWRNLNPSKKLFQQSKNRAKRRNIPFNIEISDIIVPRYCPILNILLIPGTKGNYESTPSLDRIDNSKGYIKGNVQVISKKANSMKNSGSREELLSLANWITKNYK